MNKLSIDQQTTNKLFQDLNPNEGTIPRPTNYQTQGTRPANYEQTIPRPTSYEVTINRPANYEQTINRPTTFEQTINRLNLVAKQ